MIDVEATNRRSNNEEDTATTNLLLLSGHLNPAQPETILHMEDGRTIRLDTSILLQAISTSMQPVEPELSSTSIVIPLVEERLAVGKQTVTTGTVRLHKSTEEYTQEVSETLATRTFEVERVAINQLVESAPSVRQEGNVTVYSLVEEQLVLTKQLILREEVRVLQRDTERQDSQVVTLRREQLTVERQPIE